MKRADDFAIRVQWVVGALLLSTAAGTASAQAVRPRLVALVPCGGQSGAQQPVELVGKGVERASGLFSFEPGLTAKPATPGHWTLAAAAGITPRDCDVWALSAGGWSDPRRYNISPYPQAIENEKNDSPSSAQPLTWPVVLHGRINAAVDQDWFAIELRQHEQVLIRCRTYSLDGQLEPALTIIDSQGREVCHDDGGPRDGLLHLVAPTNGTFRLKVEERAYRHPQADFYALTIEKTPLVVAAFPQVLSRGQSRQITLYGYGLNSRSKLPESSTAKPLAFEQLQSQIAAPATGDSDGGGWTPASAVMLDGFQYHLPRMAGSVRFQLVDGEVTLETDAANETQGQAQSIALPAELAGRFQLPRDVDWYRFAARQGQTLWIEAVGERLGQLMDIDLAIHDAQGNVLTTFTDTRQPKDIPAALPLDTLDPAGKWRVPADGEYFLAVRDLYGTVASGVQRSYSLSIGPMQDAVRVVATAGTLAIKPGGSATLELIAVRRGKHTAAVRVRAEKLPPGLSAAEVSLEGKNPVGSMKFSATANAAAWTGGIQLIAETQLAGKTTSAAVRIVALVQEGKPPRVRLCDGLPAAILHSPK